MRTDEDAVAEEDDWGDEFEEQPPDRCPACGGKQFGTYLWGLIQQPPRIEELVDQLGSEEVRFTGCCIDDETPRWFCQSCDADIGEDGRLINGYGFSRPNRTL